MPAEEKKIGGCPQCGSDKLICKYNLFESDDLRIDSWEHRCPNCGHRETIAFRNDEEDAMPEDGAAPDCCPYCNRKGGEDF